MNTFRTKTSVESSAQSLIHGFDNVFLNGSAELDFRQFLRCPGFLPLKMRLPTFNSSDSMIKLLAGDVQLLGEVDSVNFTLV